MNNKKEYINNVINYMNIINEPFDERKIKRLWSKANEIIDKIVFTENEIIEFNEYVKDNDIASIMDFLEDKEKQASLEIIYSKVENLWDFILDKIHNIRLDNINLNRKEFLEKLSEYEKLAVKFGDFNYQVENGGLIQWDENNYSNDLEDLIEFLNKSSYQYKEKFLEVLSDFKYIKNAINNLNTADDFYEVDKESRLNFLYEYDEKYLNIRESWRKYFENYLVKNIPNEYLNELKEIKTWKFQI